MYSNGCLAHIIIGGVLAVVTTVNSSQPYNHNLLTVVTEWDNSSYCVGGEDALTSTDVRVTYSHQVGEGQTTSDTFDISRASNAVTNYSNYSQGSETNEALRLTVLLEQLEHGGGSCNCVYGYVYRYFSGLSPQNVSFSLCNGSASIPRRQEFQWHNKDLIENYNSTNTTKEFPLQLTCQSMLPYLEISYSLTFSEKDGCNTINEFNEGVEFSVSLSSNLHEWIPLRFTYYRDGKNSSAIMIGDINDFYLRDYDVSQLVRNGSSRTVLRVCGFNSSDSVQFRWLQTSQLGKYQLYSKDVWILDDINISLVLSETENISLVSESFESADLNADMWPPHHVRNADVDTHCNYAGGLVFGFERITINETTVVSRSLLTNTFNLSLYGKSPIIANSSSVSEYYVNTTSGIQPSKTIEHLQTSDTSQLISTFNSAVSSSEAPNKIFLVSTGVKESFTTMLPSPSASSTDTLLNNASQSSIPNNPSVPSSIIMNTTVVGVSTVIADLSLSEYVLYCEKRIKTMISGDATLKSIINSKSLNESILLFKTYVNVSADKILAVYLYHYIILKVHNSSTTNLMAEKIVHLGKQTLLQKQPSGSKEKLVVATTVIAEFDLLMLFYLESFSYQDSEFVLLIQLVTLNNLTSPSFTAIDSSNFPALSGPKVALTLPVDILYDADDGDGVVKVISAIYRNIADLFSIESTTLGSDIVSTSIQCGSGICDNIQTEPQNPIIITFEHSKYTKKQLIENNMLTKCAFLDIHKTESFILKYGDWSEAGCIKNKSLSDNFTTVCECNHLTHFAILLSPSPPDYSRPVELSLTYISYTGVAVSLLAMFLTSFTFIALRSLHNMRNYIHVNLCISLSVAQIIFVVGVDQTGNSDSSVPIHCQVIAVLLHYFFLVSFMWMLMEGVVLYVSLVHVFVQKKKGYIISFTIASYGLPFLYMGIVTIPLGFSLPGENYGSHRACYLNSSNHFIWAIICPFLLIFVANVIFFVITARIMWHHQMRQTQKSKLQRIRKWFRSAISLLVIMSITWIAGILIIKVDTLLPLAFVYTIMIAFQGLFIFIIFVVWSKSVREAYIKWWRANISRSELLSNLDSKWNSNKLEKPTNPTKSTCVSEKIDRKSKLSQHTMSGMNLSLKGASQRPTTKVDNLEVHSSVNQGNRFMKKDLSNSSSFDSTNMASDYQKMSTC